MGAQQRLWHRGFRHMIISTIMIGFVAVQIWRWSSVTLLVWVGARFVAVQIWRWSSVTLLVWVGARFVAVQIWRRSPWIALTPARDPFIDRYAFLCLQRHAPGIARSASQFASPHLQNANPLDDLD
jgi:hypothetical protein